MTVQRELARPKTTKRSWHLAGGNHGEIVVPCRASAAALDHTWDHRTATGAAAGASLRGAAKVNTPRETTVSLASVPCYITITANQCCDHGGRRPKNGRSERTLKICPANLRGARSLLLYTWQTGERCMNALPKTVWRQEKQNYFESIPVVLPTNSVKIRKKRTR